ncbi:MAG: imidazole glycerol phosphate synthase subunit HisH [Phycisphaeraceae bacterium]|nr:imidazole glycerol phosphate synthase subunit HisH [Phycisphaeraceae bacterium]
MIGIIDYRMGNLRSVEKALETVGAGVRILREPHELDETIEGLVLPGVGAFADGMDQLRRGGWVDPIGDFIGQGKPFLGICLGMQLLFESSEEGASEAGAPVEGLGVLPGRVKALSPGRDASGRRLKVPHMGWNALAWDREDPLMAGVQPGAHAYFVHGYFAEPAEEDGRLLVSAQCDYGGTFCASVWRDRLWATQFHPEKSQRVGLRMLANFAGVAADGSGPAS